MHSIHEWGKRHPGQTFVIWLVALLVVAIPGSPLAGLVMLALPWVIWVAVAAFWHHANHGPVMADPPEIAAHNRLGLR